MLRSNQMICIIILFYSLKFTSKSTIHRNDKDDVSDRWNLVAGEHQRKLLRYLLEENQHNPLERPVYNDSHTLTVTMNLALQQIIDFVSENISPIEITILWKIL